MSYGENMRRVIAERGIVPFIGVYDVFSASMAAKHFDGLFLSGFGFAASYYGLPDIGFIAWPDVVAYVERIRTVLPHHHLVVDIDDGYCDPEVACHVVSLLESAGASAVVLEDQKRPRKCGHFSGKQLLNIEDFQQKLEKVLDTRREMMVVARTDASDVDDIRRRIRAFSELGPDAILVDAVKDLNVVKELQNDVQIPFAFNQIAGGLSPSCDLDQLQAVGVNLVIYSTPCLFAAQTAIENAMQELQQRNGRLPEDSIGVKDCSAVLFDNLARRDTVRSKDVESPARELTHLTIASGNHEPQENNIAHTHADLGSNPTVHELLKFHAEQSPTTVAIASPGQRPLTYERLQTHVESVVSALRSMGIDRKDRVAIVLDNGPDLAVAFLAVASAAGAAPLNPAYREEDFEFYLSDLGAKALIVAAGVDSPARAVATKHRIPVIELTSSESYAGIFTIQGVGDAAEVEATLAEPNDEALLLHTSGTTSRPKLVPLTQRNICASAGNVAAALELTQQDCCLNVMPLFHIHGLIGAILSSVTAGGSIVCTPGFDSEQFFAWLDEFQPTWYTAVPTMHQAVLGQADEHREVIQRTALRLIRSSSSSLPPSVMEELEHVFRAPVIESYGMTEAAHQMCSNPLPPKQRKPGAVGLPAGPDVAIMDEDGNLLGPESTGEIVIRGTNVTSGYANNPAANESAFSNGWFRTGDLGRTDNEGYLYISGRLKEIINRGGEKVSPREIDEALLDHPAIRQAVSFAVPHDGLGEDIAAAVVLSDGSEENEQAIRTFLFSRLADFKVPSRVVFVDEIPKGPTGKLQRIGLYERLAPYFEAQFVAPEGPVEQSLAKFYGELLRHEDIGIHDNFFFLGGDSLSATRLVSRVRVAFQIELPLSSVFREPTISGLAPMIEDLVIQQIEETG